jgi:hypothetical protein
MIFAVEFLERNAAAARCKAQAVRLHYFLQPRPESARFVSHFVFVVIAIQDVGTVSFGAHTAAAAASWTTYAVVGIVR